MTQGPQAAPSPRRAAEALLAFWSEAGVSVSAAGAPLNRLAERPPPASPRPTPPLSLPAAPSHSNPSAPQDGAAAARAAAEQAGDLAALVQAIAAFEGCALRPSGARRPVILRGDPARADILVIGDAPSAEDEAAGEPFRGAEGRLLDRMLVAAGLSERMLALNTVFWRTPGGAAPGAADQASCRPFLERVAALLQPKAVLVLGASAARGVLQTSEPILKLRGRWASWPIAGGAAVPALPTFAPAFLLAQPMAKKQAWGDLLTLAARIDPLGPLP